MSSFIETCRLLLKRVDLYPKFYVLYEQGICGCLPELNCDRVMSWLKQLLQSAVALPVFLPLLCLGQSGGKPEQKGDVSLSSTPVALVIASG